MSSTKTYITLYFSTLLPTSSLVYQTVLPFLGILVESTVLRIYNKHNSFPSYLARLLYLS